MQTVRLARKMDVVAPDGSEIRLLVIGERSSMVHCRLSPETTSSAVAHRRVEEVWYCLAGRGELWRLLDDIEELVALTPGVSVDIPTGAAFQFRNTGVDDLDILIVTTPPWPGADEAMMAENHWRPSIDITEEE